ncbi:hypothetical protein NA78x_001357 [Anatilimnocola sp. NA78]|uniref:hypothetical protein n=1 Tax=Anatilimnocola sp. NA78 TaxID=3415683 RepID=UPI003CE4EC40
MIRYTLLATVGLLVLSGCGSKSNSVKGKVTFNGQPVTGGSLTFLPQVDGTSTGSEVGKPAVATVGSDGSYSVVPGSDGGGAIAGKHRVTYSAPVAETPAGVEYKPGQGPPLSPFHGLRPKEEMVEVKAGANTLDIELVK